MSGLKDEFPIYKLRSTGFLSSTIFTVPAGVYQISVTVVGGGGGAMLYNLEFGSGRHNFLGGGGSGGWVIRENMPTIPGDQIEVQVGGGGLTIGRTRNMSTIPTPPEVTDKAGDGGNTVVTNLRTGQVVIAYGGEGAKPNYGAGDGGFPNGSGGGVWFSSVGGSIGRYSGGCGVYKGGGSYQRRSAGNIATVQWIVRTPGAGEFPGVGGCGGRTPSPIIAGLDCGSGGDYNVPTVFANVPTDLRSDLRPGKLGVVFLEWMAT